MSAVDFIKNNVSMIWGKEYMSGVLMTHEDHIGPTLKSIFKIDEESNGLIIYPYEPGDGTRYYMEYHKTYMLVSSRLDIKPPHTDLIPSHIINEDKMLDRMASGSYKFNDLLGHIIVGKIEDESDPPYWRNEYNTTINNDVTKMAALFLYLQIKYQHKQLVDGPLVSLHGMAYKGLFSKDALQKVAKILLDSKGA